MKYGIPPRELAMYGQGKDSLVAHISPKEAMMLKSMGGSGTVNPYTGLLQFDDNDSVGDTADTDQGNAMGGQATADSFGSGVEGMGGLEGSYANEATNIRGYSAFGDEDTRDRDEGLGILGGLHPGQSFEKGTVVESGWNQFGRGVTSIATGLVGGFLGGLSPVPGGAFLGAKGGREIGRQGYDIALDASRHPGNYQTASLPTQSTDPEGIGLPESRPQEPQDIYSYIASNMVSLRRSLYERPSDQTRSLTGLRSGIPTG
jgi:hypothetical protein